MWPFRKSGKKKEEKKQRIPDHVILVFPKGTVVNFNGIPCQLLIDTPYESEHIRANNGRT